MLMVDASRAVALRKSEPMILKNSVGECDWGIEKEVCFGAAHACGFVQAMEQGNEIGRGWATGLY